MYKRQTWLCALVVRPFVGPPAALHGSGEEIKLLAERGAQAVSYTHLPAAAGLLLDVTIGNVAALPSVSIIMRKSASSV